MTSSGLETSGIRDNHHRGSIGDFLKEKIIQGSDLSFVSAYFMIYAYAALKDRVEARMAMVDLAASNRKLLEEAPLGLYAVTPTLDEGN